MLHKRPTRFDQFQTHRRPAAPGGCTHDGGAGPWAGDAMALREAEAELRRRLVVVQVVRWVPRAGEGRKVDRHPEVREDTSYRPWLGDDSEDAQPAVALGALQNVHRE